MNVNLSFITREIVSFAVFAILVALAMSSRSLLHRLNLTALDDTHENQQDFIAERAYRHLKTLNDMGPKVVGSKANEVEAFNYILGLVNKIRDESTTQNISVSHQIVSGTTFINSMYRDLQNIVVRIQGKTDHAVMLNCHFDSVPGSPGASDDAVMCCVMIEIMRALSLSKEPTEHSIIFLFNGAEEQDLQAAHGFITQHPWAREIQGYINLESTGSGGREILFRSGPKHDWLLRMYRQSAPHPFGHGVAEELFETGVIPSATDFQIFRDDGEIPGIDFAYVEAGWRYHTRYDSIDYITRESIQHTGENILALTKQMANSKEIADPPEGDYAIYFDYLGFFFVSYTRVVGIVINILISLIAIILPFILQSRLQIVKNFGFVLKETLISFGTILISTILSFGICYLLAVLMNAVDNSMSWFNTIFISIGMYGSLAIATQIFVYHMIQLLRKRFQSKSSNFDLDEGGSKDYKEEAQNVQVQFNGVNLFWAVLTLLVTALGYRFGYITMIILLFSIVSNLLVSLCMFCPASINFKHFWIVFHCLGHAFSYMFLSYMMIQVWELFVPIAAKQYYSNPDILIALICVLWSVVCYSYFIPLTTLIRLRGVLYSILLTVFLISFIISFTSIGFPYSDNKSEPRLQRFRVIHIKRSYYNLLNEEKVVDTGYLISTIDRNSVRTINSAFNSSYPMKHWLDDDEFMHVANRGHPRYSGLTLDRGFYLESETAPSVPSIKFRIHTKSWSLEDPSKFSIMFTAPFTALTQIYLVIEDNWELVDTSLSLIDDEYNGQRYKGGRVSVGLQPSQTVMEFFDFKSLNGTSRTGKIATLTLINVESVFKQGEEYKEIMSIFPDYTFAFEQQADSSIYEIGV